MSRFFLHLLLILSVYLHGAQEGTEGNSTEGKRYHSVMLYGDEVLQIHAPIGIFTAQQRAEQISDTLLAISKKNNFDPSKIETSCKESGCLIQYESTPIMAVTPEDIQYTGNGDLNSSAEEVASLLKQTLEKVHADHEIMYILRQVGIVAGMFAALAGFLYLLEKVFGFFYKKLGGSLWFKTLKFREFELLQGETLRLITISGAKLTRLSLSLLSIYYFIVYAFMLLPWMQDYDPKPLLQKIMWAVFSTLITFFLIKSSSAMHVNLLRKLLEFKKSFFKPLEFGGFTILSVQKEMELVGLMARAFMFGFILFVLYSYITFVFSLFDFTKTWAETLIVYVMTPIKVVIKSMIDYIPNIFYIIVIVYAFRYLLKMIHYFFEEIDKENLKFEGFYHEWALPTYGVVRVMIIMFAAIVIFPYLPGSNSPFFQGISIFVGLLFSLGSSSAIANIVAGIVLIYMRPFKIGDRVKIADTVGDVVEKNFLVTRIRTIKNADITIPNSSILGGHIINYSSSSADNTGFILNTTVTIGYDVPWREVHALLIKAAGMTEDILAEPAPFVLQTSLDDFYVSYELNAYTDKPGRMARTYSNLHSAIQDCFNEAGVEIMSPHYSTLRDGNETTIPSDYRDEGYSVPVFGVKLKTT